jgi:hypothetical protein
MSSPPLLGKQLSSRDELPDQRGINTLTFLELGISRCCFRVIFT